MTQAGAHEWQGGNVTVDLFPKPPGGPFPREDDYPPEVWTQNEPEIPDAWNGVPMPNWAQANSAGLMSHYHIDQMRWIQVRALLLKNESIDIHLVTGSGDPLVGIEVPPMVTMWAHGTRTDEGDDPVTDPVSYIWQDFYTSAPMVEGVSGELRFWSWSLRLSRDGDPHWILRLRAEVQTDQTDYLSFLVNISSNGAVFYDSGPTPTSVGSDWVSGHYAIDFMWETHTGTDGVDTRDVINGTRTDINRRLMARGAIDVAASSSGNLYLATPAGLATDTNVFSLSYVPSVLVLATPSSYSWGETRTHGDETTWLPSSLGHGFKTLTGAASPPANHARIAAYGYQALLTIVSGRWQVNITQQASGFTKTFYVWAWGR